MFVLRVPFGAVVQRTWCGIGFNHNVEYVLNDDRGAHRTSAWEPPTAEARLWQGYVYIPCWMPPVFLGIYPALLLILRRPLRRRYRRKHDLCMHCGYNLTGNTSGTCPECGTPTCVER